MNREIKFRAWDKEDKIMMHLDIFCCPKAVLKDEIILMQYTGLKDKNSKEIYEGDIVVEVFDNGADNIIEQHIRDEFEGEVVYQQEVASFGIKTEKDGIMGLYEEADEIEVIGNIYENPELLR